MSQISIIVPVYNVEKYLSRCIDSILNQTFDDFELILIDDGSPDHSGSICDDYAKKDNRILVIHKENGGLSDARNAGINIASGEYIMFVDSDDYISKDMCEILYQRIIKDKSDMALCSVIGVNEEGEEIEKGTFIVDDRLLEEKDKFLGLGEANACAYIVAWNKLFKKFLWKDIRFPVNKINEDEYVAHHLIDKCDKISTVSDSLYYYVQRDNSIMNSACSLKRLDGVEACIERLKFMIAENLFNAMSYTVYLIINTMNGVYENLDMNVESVNKRVNTEKKEINKLFKKLITKKVPIKTKIHMLIFVLNPHIYRQLLKYIVKG